MDTGYVYMMDTEYVYKKDTEYCLHVGHSTQSAGYKMGTEYWL